MRSIVTQASRPASCGVGVHAYPQSGLCARLRPPKAALARRGRIRSVPSSKQYTKTQTYNSMKRVLAVVSDLFFSVKLSEAAKRNNLALEFVKDADEVLEKAKEKPTLIV